MNSPKKHICYLCGKSIELNEMDKDHVPSDLIFPKSIKKTFNLSRLVTLETHKSCNRQYSKNEEQFVSEIGTLKNENPIHKELWKDLSGTLKHNRKLYRNIKSNFFDKSPMGIYLPQGKLIRTIDEENTKKIIRKIVRGLFFIHYGKILPDYIKWLIFLYDPDNAVKPYSEAERTFAESVLNLGEEQGEYKAVFAYKRLVLPENKLYGWAFLFWDSIIFIAFHHNENCLGPNCMCKEL